MPGTTRPNLGLTTGYSLLEDNWHTGMESNLRMLDALLFLTVLDKDLTTPPGSPNDGDRYIIPSGATGDWSGHTGKVTVWEAGLVQWTKFTPKNGWRAFVADEGAYYIYSTEATDSWRRESVVNVMDFATFQAAHDALPAGGGVIYIPGGTYTSSTSPAFTGMTITKQTALIGEPRGPANAITTIIHSNANTDAFFFNITSGGVMKDIFIQGAGSSGTGRLVRWYKAATSMAGFTLDNVTCFQSPNWAFEFICDSGHYVSKVDMVQCTAYESASGGSMWLGASGGSTNNNWFTRCEFNGPGFGTYSADSLERGAVHLVRASLTRFLHCSFQGNDDSPCLSIDEIGNYCVLRDCYIERVNTANTPVPPITVRGPFWNLLIDGIYHYQPETAGGMRFFKSGTAGLYQAKFSNLQFLTNENPPAGANVIILGSATDELELDNVQQISSVTGDRYEVTVNGGAVLTIASAATIRIPNTVDNVFKVSGTANITSITAARPKRWVTLLFTGTAGGTGLTDGSNLKLNGNFVYTPDDTITLVCDGTNWFEVGRSPN